MNDLVTRLRAYEAASNRGDVAACVAMFTDDGAIDDHGARVQGRVALCAAHEFDRAVEAVVTFDEVRAEENTVTCRFVYRKSLDRLLGLDGLHQRARFEFRDGLIAEFAIFGAEEAEMERHLARKRPFFAWAKQHHPDELTRSRSFDGEGGRALRSLETAWVAAGRPTDLP